MLPAGSNGGNNVWQYFKIKNGHLYKSAYGSVAVMENPWAVEFRDAKGNLLTKTRHSSDNKGFCANMPFCVVRRAADYSRSVWAVFEISPDEKIFGCGESFTSLNKYGQKVNLYTCDPNGVETPGMYKPIPFFMSSRGYGMFMHTSTPITCDFGNTYGASNALMIGDESLDLFVFLGEPKDILDEYTNLTGKAPMPPLWSFGLWMSRITYFSEADGRNIAAKLRANNIPTDVLHKEAWQIDNEYLFGSDILVAPLFEEGKKERDVYLPQGQWIDYQTGKIYTSGWHSISCDKIEAIIMVREGAIIPHIKKAQSTKDLDWSNIELVAYTNGNEAKGIICLPNDNILRGVSVSKKGKTFMLNNAGLPSGVNFKVTAYK